MPVEAVRRDKPEQDPRRIVGLHVLNVSRGGMGVTSQEALPPDERVVVFLPPLGPAGGQDAVGQVVRCDDVGDYYSVGIVFEEPLPEPQEARSD